MEKEKEIKTPKEYKIKKIEELKEKMPEYMDEIAHKCFCFTAVILLNESVKTSMQPLFSVMSIIIASAFLANGADKHRYLMEIDRLETDLKLDGVTESEFIQMLENKKLELSELNKENHKKFIINCALGVLSIISACVLHSLDVPLVPTLLSLVAANGFLDFVDKNDEMKAIAARIDQVEEKQEMFELTRKRK